MSEKPTSSTKFSSTILTGFLLLLTGCNNGEAIQSLLSPDPQLSTSQDTTTDNSITPSSQENNSVSTAEKNPKITKSAPELNFILDLPSDFPPEIPLYPEAIVEESILQGEETGTTILRSQDNSESIINYYQKKFYQNDWEIIQPFKGESEELDQTIEPDQTIIASRDSLKVKVSVIPQQLNETVQIAISYKPFDDSLLSEANSEYTATSDNQTPETPATDFSDLGKAPEQLREAIQEIAALDILTPHLKEGQVKIFAPNESVTRRDYARWLIAANNKYYARSPGKKIRLATPDSELAFQDVKHSDPDFGAIQGLAEAGLIPSVLTQESDSVLFRPEAPLTREDLLVWKVPLDIRKALPKASIENIQDSWGFQDTTKIGTPGVRALFADYQNGDRSNVRRIFGYTTLFQPKKPVTRGEAAASVWYFGFQGDGITAKEVLKVKSNDTE